MTQPWPPRNTRYTDPPGGGRALLVDDFRKSGYRKPACQSDPSATAAGLSQGFSDVRAQAFAATADEVVRQYETPIDNKIDIRKMLFGGFKKCLYPAQKFDSDTERRLVVIIEKDKAVIKWFMVGKGAFQIRYSNDAEYEPDFVVETETEKLICGPKGADRMHEPVVLAKARAAPTGLQGRDRAPDGEQGQAAALRAHPAQRHRGQHDLDGMGKRFTFAAPEEGK